MVKKLPDFCGSLPRDIRIIWPLGPVLSQFESVHTLTLKPFYIWISQIFSSLQTFRLKFCILSYFFHGSYVVSSNSSWRILTMVFLIMRFSPSCYLLSLEMEVGLSLYLAGRHAMGACWRDEGVAPYILWPRRWTGVGGRLRASASLTPGRGPRCLLDGGLGEPRSQCGRGGGEGGFRPPPGFEPRSPDRPARSQSLYRLSYHLLSLRFDYCLQHFVRDILNLCSYLSMKDMKYHYRRK
jgi:hypothetical protein